MKVLHSTQAALLLSPKRRHDWHLAIHGRVEFWVGRQKSGHADGLGGGSTGATAVKVTPELDDGDVVSWKKR